MLGHISTGAADDLAKATQIAREMVMRYGMDEALGCVSHDSNRAVPYGMGENLFMPPSNPVSEATQQKLDAAIAGLLSHNLERATRILSTNRDLLERCSQALLKMETLDADALKALTASLVQEPAVA